MLRSRLTVLLAIFALVTPMGIHATDGVTESSPRLRQATSRPLEIQEIQDGRQNLREEAQERTQTFRSRVAENHANRLERRFKFYFDRLTNIINRFQTRLDKLKSDGKDISSVQSKLDAAKTKLASAKSLGEQAVAGFRAIDPAKFSEQKSQALAARDLAVQARAAFIEVHKLLKDALKLLKTISKPALPAASTAVENAL